MGQKIEIPASLLEFGGLKVALVSALNDAIDSIEVKRKLVSGTFFDGTRTANNSYDLSGFAGTQLLYAQFNITAHSGNTVILGLQKLMPDGVTYTDIARWDVTTTANKFITAKADGAASAVGTRTSLGISSGSVVDGPWGDTLRFVVNSSNWTGTSITVKATIYAL